MERGGECIDQNVVCGRAWQLFFMVLESGRYDPDYRQRMLQGDDRAVKNT